jgi:hypothetical protein
MNTLADRILEEWNNRKTTFGVKQLVTLLDPDYRMERTEHPFSVTYSLSDGSKVLTKGKGSSFRIYAL